MIKISFNKFHNKYEVYYHRRGKQHLAYAGSWTEANRMRQAAQRVVDTM